MNYLEIGFGNWPYLPFGEFFQAWLFEPDHARVIHARDYLIWKASLKGRVLQKLSKEKDHWLLEFSDNSKARLYWTKIQEKILPTIHEARFHNFFSDSSIPLNERLEAIETISKKTNKNSIVIVISSQTPGVFKAKELEKEFEKKGFKTERFSRSRQVFRKLYPDYPGYLKLKEKNGLKAWYYWTRYKWISLTRFSHYGDYRPFVIAFKKN
ncbi:hypothetical protein HUU53_01795 [Candidatus Micrarchaeota archaeon]|nr:hypothetical protein [Candidatus Micrarchaeota archaeon]